MKRKTGIYKIKNLINNKVYIGSSVDIDKRWKLHKDSLIQNKHHSILLQRSFNKHGKDNFIYDIIEECEKEILIEREQYWIDTLDSYNNGYNILPKAGSCLGNKVSDETKRKMSIIKLGSNNPNYGKNHSYETKRKMKNKLEGENNPATNLTNNVVNDIRDLYLKGKKISDLIEIFNVKELTLRRIVNNKTWKDEKYNILLTKHKNKIF